MGLSERFFTSTIAVQSLLNPKNTAMQTPENAVRTWLQSIVIDLNLCPFARQPQERGTLRIRVSKSRTEEELLIDLQREMERMQLTPAQELETTLLVITDQLHDFYDYNQFLDAADWLIKKMEWEGVFQVASFHPNYQFAGTAPDAAENYTNRAPYPILHILREESLEQAINHYPDVDSIPERNIVRMNQLSKSQLQKLFPYIDSK